MKNWKTRKELSDSESEQLLSVCAIESDSMFSHEKIYVDYDFITEFSAPDIDHLQPPLKQIPKEKWGIHSIKPVEQTQWDKKVAHRIQTIADDYPYLSPDFHNNRNPYIPGDISSVHIPSSSDKRPYLYDKQLKHWQLVDSNAAVSIWPTRLFPDAVLTK